MPDELTAPKLSIPPTEYELSGVDNYIRNLDAARNRRKIQEYGQDLLDFATDISDTYKYESGRVRQLAEFALGLRR